MSWKPTTAAEYPGPGGRHHARLVPLDSVTWGHVKAEWTFTFHRLTVDGRPLQGVYTQDLVWQHDERRLAAVAVNNQVEGDGGWSYASPDWQPDLTLVVLDLARGLLGRAAFAPGTTYVPKAFEGDAIVYDKIPTMAGSPIREMEVAVDAITDWRPAWAPESDGP